MMNTEYSQDKSKGSGNSAAHLSKEEIEEIEIELAAMEALSNFDLHADDVTLRRAQLIEHMRDTSEKLHQEALRNGRRAQAHKAAMRVIYAEMIMRKQGRTIRPYEKATPSRRKAQKAAAKANRSPDQIEWDKISDRERKAAKRKLIKETQTIAMKKK